MAQNSPKWAKILTENSLVDWTPVLNEGRPALASRSMKMASRFCAVCSFLSSLARTIPCSVIRLNWGAFILICLISVYSRLHDSVCAEPAKRNKMCKKLGSLPVTMTHDSEKAFKTDSNRNR